jgi:hypothetical protein
LSGGPSRSGGRQHRSSALRAAGLVAAAAATWTAVRAVNRSLRRVRGSSMRPTLQPGDLVLVVPISPRSGPRVGQVVLARDPRQRRRETVKRVVATAGQPADLAGLPELVPAACVALAGDAHAQSTDSRHYGAVPVHLLSGRVVLRIWPGPGRIGGPPHARPRLT